LGTSSGTARVKFWVTCSGSDSSEASGSTLGYDSGKVLGSDLGQELGIVSDKGSGKNLGKEAGQDKTCKTRRFLCFGVNPT
jgi:hypothetical protein